MKKIKLFAAILFCANLSAQTFTPGLSVYGEAYAGYDFNNPGTQARPGFIVSHNRLNELALNLLRIDYGHASGDRSRFKLALQTGTYVERNLAFEPPALRPLAEAYLGFKA
ncbi:MAG: outer membrane beta-barrel protein, partial [Bacteroidia bacterium]